MYFKSPGIFKRWVWQSYISCPTNKLTSCVHCWWYKSICRNRDIAVWCCRTIKIASNLQLDTRLMHKRIKGISKHRSKRFLYQIEYNVFPSSTCFPASHHVIVGGGLAPTVWQRTSTSFPAETGSFLFSIVTDVGPTENQNWHVS